MKSEKKLILFQKGAFFLSLTLFNNILFSKHRQKNISSSKHSSSHSYHEGVTVEYEKNDDSVSVVITSPFTLKIKDGDITEDLVKIQIEALGDDQVFNTEIIFTPRSVSIERSSKLQQSHEESKKSTHSQFYSSNVSFAQNSFMQSFSISSSPNIVLDFDSLDILKSQDMHIVKINIATKSLPLAGNQITGGANEEAITSKNENENEKNDEGNQIDK